MPGEEVLPSGSTAPERGPAWEGPAWSHGGRAGGHMVGDNVMVKNSLQLCMCIILILLKYIYILCTYYM